MQGPAGLFQGTVSECPLFVLIVISGQEIAAKVCPFLYAFDFDAAVAKVIAPSCLDSRTMRRY